MEFDVARHLKEALVLKKVLKEMLAKHTGDWDFGSSNLTTTGIGIFGYVNITDEENGYKVDGTRILSLKGDSILVGVAGNFTMSGADNVIVGNFAGGALTSGYENSFIGTQSGFSVTEGGENTFVGISAGASVTTGDSNIAIGGVSAFSLTTGDGNIIIGNSADVSGVAASNELNIGDAITGNLSTGDITIANDLTVIGTGTFAEAVIDGTTGDIFTITDGTAEGTITMKGKYATHPMISMGNISNDVNYMFSMKGFTPGIRQWCIRETGVGLAFNLNKLYVENDTTSAIFGEFGVFGLLNQGSTPACHYLYLDALTNGAYNNTTLKIDANNRIGIAIPGSGRPTATLDVYGDAIFGDGTNELQIGATGDVVFVGSAGLCYGEIYVVAAGDTITITTAGKANKVQITSFDTNGASNNSTPDHTNDHITITKAGFYLCTVSLHIESAGGGGADTFGFSVYKNNGTTEFANVHSHRKLAGGGGDVGSASLSGILDLTANDTIELWCWNEDSTDNLIVQDATLSLIQIGGT